MLVLALAQLSHARMYAGSIGTATWVRTAAVHLATWVRPVALRTADDSDDKRDGLRQDSCFEDVDG